MNKKRAETAIGLLQRVASGGMNADVALATWPEIDSEDDPLLTASWHDLSHFAADTDIRGRDASYAAYQRELLLRRATEIKEKYRLT
jgi:hypothetical protein